MLFSDGAGRLAGLAAALLGWRPDEFWRTTPAELAGVLRAMAGDDGEPAGAAELRRLKEMFPDDRQASCRTLRRAQDRLDPASAFSCSSAPKKVDPGSSPG